LVLALLAMVMGTGCAHAVRDPLTPPARPDSPDGKRMLRLLTWNVGEGDLWSGVMRDSAMEAVADTLTAVKADVVALQGMKDEGQVKALVVALKKRELTLEANAARAWPGTSEGYSVLLFRAEDERSRTVWKTSKGHAVVGLWGQVGTVINVHAPARWAGDRRDYFNELARWASSRLPPVILAGDYELDRRGSQLHHWFTGPETDRKTFKELTRRFHFGTELPTTSRSGRELTHVRVRKGKIISQYVLEGHRVGRMVHDPVLVHITE
ncbi:MAG: endonuclease/exonuclease/phosphatase family protein, partial [Myxococcota bacterium]|nr:endonuclease/exonuclease/phosphatase family protein [Myxococcota bacterium]